MFFLIYSSIDFYIIFFFFFDNSFLSIYLFIELELFFEYTKNKIMAKAIELNQTITELFSSEFFFISAIFILIHTLLTMLLPNKTGFAEKKIYRNTVH
jgi:hypothetical protein